VLKNGKKKILGDTIKIQYWKKYKSVALQFSLPKELTFSVIFLNLIFFMILLN
jgi:hypothetical protein